MNDSISDILASVTRAHNAATDYHGDTSQSLDLQLLTRSWISERVAPELLPYPTELMERVLNRTRRQIELIEERTASMDAGTSFGLVIIQTELERFKFLVRSYLRTRIAKIDAHTLHILERHRASPSSDFDPTNPLLSSQEMQYAQTHAALLERHYSASFLSAFPPKLQRLDDKAGAGGAAMVEGPDLNKAVFVRCLGRPLGRRMPERPGALALLDDDDEMEDRTHDQRYGVVSVSCGFTTGHEQDADDGRDISRRGNERVVDMSRGDIWVIRWSAVRNAVARGECELL